MNDASPRHELREWIAQRLDPLHDHAVEGGPRTSDYDLTPDGWTDVAAGELKAAAVLVGLIDREGSLNVLLTRRADSLRSHTGQTALPGGRQDPGETSVETALREAHEEVGLEPRFVNPIGLSTPYQTGSGYLITPVVAFVAPGFTLTANPQEVADIFETPFGFLMDPANYQEHERAMPSGETRRFYAMTHDEKYIWGATAGILRALRDRLYGAAVA